MKSPRISASAGDPEAEGVPSGEKPPGEGRSNKRRRIHLSSIPPIAAAYMVAVALLVLGAFLQPGFLSPVRVVTVLTLASVLGILAAGQTVAIIAGGIDLSIGATLSFVEVMTIAWGNGSNENWYVLVVLIAIASGVGAVNALGISLLGISPLIMTLGTGAIMTGAVLLITNGNPTGRPVPGLSWFMTARIAGFPFGQVLVWAVVSVLTVVTLHRTYFGRSVYAFGTNPRTARLAGLRELPMTLGVYVYSSVMAAVAGIVLAGFVASGQYGVGSVYLFPSIAAVVIGGTSILGGSGSYLGTIAGVVILQVIENLLNLASIQAASRDILSGIAILVILFAYGRQRRLRQ